MKSIVNAHPFFQTSFGPSPVSLDVDGLAPSSVRLFLCGVFFVFAILVENFLSPLFAHVFTQSGAKHLFSVQTDSSHIIARTWMVVQAEEASLAKALQDCSKHTFYMSFYVFETILDVLSKIVKNRKKS